ncbi:MAG TPA: phenylalanine--tRNA ligase subunit beta [Candidatus Saccharimonadales bacterium]
MLSKFYGNLDLTTQDVDMLVEKIGAQLGAVEEVENLGAKYQGIFVVKVVECDPLENSDHLHRCLVDDGGVVTDVEREANGFVQVLTGAPNVHKDMVAVWLPPGSTVPESVGKDPFVLTARPMRGAMSHGMLASQRELGLGDNHEGLLEITDDIKPGTPIIEAFNLDDHVIDIENKMFTHRPDCFGLLGVYRELTAILGQHFVGPEWYGGHKYDLNVEADVLPLKVTNELPELVSRFMMVPMSNITVGPSPLWLQVHLSRVGIRAINNVVDITNFLMVLTGQPLHAYDYDKVKTLTKGDTAEITVRKPRSEEKINLLNGKEIEPRPEAIMIAAGDHLIGVGGVIGGADTEVDDQTRNIILEVGTFDMYSIRRTSMAHGLFTDAVTRFNKGQSPLQNPYVLAKAIHEVRTLAGGKLAGDVQDLSQAEGRVWVHPPVPVDVQFINERLGLALTAEEIKTLLENVECKADIAGDTVTVTAPFWRTDIELREDVVEEVGRLYGFDRLPLILPRRSIKPVAKNTTLELKSRLRNALAKAGANEVLTYSFVHGDLLKKAGQDPEHAFQVGNALSPDLQYYRLSLMPSLLDKVHLNIKAGYDEFALFELGKGHYAGQTGDDGLPREDELLAFTITANDKLKKAGAPYYSAKKYLETLLTAPLTYKPVPADMQSYDITKPYDMNRAAFIYSGDTFLGIIGEFRAGVIRALKLPKYSAGFELDVAALAGLTDISGYAALPRFPKITQDITLKVADSLPYRDLFTLVQTKLNELKPGQTQLTVEPLDIYQRADDAAHKQITFRVQVASYEKTLRDAEVNRLLDGAAVAAQKEYSAERV